MLTYCNENKIHVIARTGASSSEDQLLVIDDQTIIVDASAMNRLIKLDTENTVSYTHLKRYMYIQPFSTPPSPEL